MSKLEDYQTTQDPAWCPGCGNFPIRECLQEALVQLGKEPHEVLLVTGIGQGAKMPHYVRVNGFNGLHGRALPAGVGAAVANHRQTTIVESGDGDTYGEGGNHLLHNIRRNPDIAHFVHNNQVYGLTKGQASPTSPEGMVTGVQKKGVQLDPLNPVLLATALGAGFVARGFSGEKEHLVNLMKEAITFKGYALLDILHPCVTFNKVNTLAWYKKRVYFLEEDSHDPNNDRQALEKAREFGDKIPLGIIYRREKATFAERVGLKGEKILAERETDLAGMKKLLDAFR